MKRSSLSAFAALAALVVAMQANTQTTNAEEKVQIKPVLSGLNNPSGVAIQPGTGAIFVSDSANHQVLRVDAKTGKSSPVITGFPNDVYGKGPKYDIGPLGLAFLDEETLVVGGGGLPDAEELVTLYTVPAAGKSIKADDCKYKLGPIGPGEASLKGEGNFYAVAVGKQGIYITSNGDDTKGWVLKIGLADGTPGELTPFIATKMATNVDAPVGITMNKEGQIVVGQMGEINVPTDSLLTVYDAESGKMISNATTGLYDITSLAYSPKTGSLYALDFAWMKTEDGGLYRLNVTTKGETTEVKAEKITSLDKATAMAFAADGTLYVTVFGTAKPGASGTPGQLLSIKGAL